jgi:hypothetical protein
MNTTGMYCWNVKSPWALLTTVPKGATFMETVETRIYGKKKILMDKFHEFFWIDPRTYLVE